MEPFIPEPLPIRAVALETLVPQIGRANRAVALLEGVLYGVPNADILLSPLTTQEAVLSSKIEGTQATLAEVLKFEAGEEPREEARREDIREILNYRRALREAERELETRPFNLNLLLRVHEILLDSVRGRDKSRGRIRTTQNWIGPPGTPIEDALFVPPDPHRLKEHLSDWEKYYHLERPDPLTQLAVVHAQFEIIHPFLDGNGRLGRILIPLYLYERKLLSRPVFYLSAWLEEHRDDYGRHLRALGKEEGAWNRWIEFFLRGIEEQATRNAKKARAIMALYDKLKHRVLELTRSRFAIPLLDHVFLRPVFRSSDLEFSKPWPSKPMVAQLLRVLRDAGILAPLREGAGRRATVYAFAELVNLCEGREVIPGERS